MKILGIKTAYRLTKQKVVNTVCVLVVSALCAASAIAVNTILNYSDVQALRVDSGDMVDVYDVIPAEIAPDRDTYNIKNPVASSNDYAEKLGQTDPTLTKTDEPEETEEETTTTETEETSSETEEETTSETTTESAEPTTSTTETTQAAKKSITQSAYKKTVYARTTVNIRTGPGTGYKVVRKVTVNQPISVVAKTSNGWYKTSDGYYVKQSLTTPTLLRPATKAPTKKPTSKPKTTTKKTTTPKVATKTTVKTVNGVKCKITFYGPVLYKRKDGSTFYSTTTATGTKCKQGRTCAADWKVFPKNSWIYIENDPLGGDGLYKVEDTGRFTGNWIDIYVDSAKGHNTCYRKVYKQ